MSARREIHMAMQDDESSPDPVALLRKALGDGADIRPPGTAEEPILAKSVRGAMFAWLTEINSAAELLEVGLRARSTALLYGPPGTGKTTLAHHLAARLGIPLVVVGSESIMAMYLGEGEKNVAKLFKGLKSAGVPCVLLLDELEAIGGRRDMNSMGGADNARTSILTVLLRYIEEYTGYVVAATNRQQDIDPALWRRFHLQVPIDLPGEDERFAIMRRYLSPWRFSDDDMDILTTLTEGTSPALLRGLMEGMKRQLIVRPKVRLPIDNILQVMNPVIDSCAPPPELTAPELWRNPAARQRLKDLTWPPIRDAA